MHRRVVKKSEVVREGYVKGLQEARRIIESMLGEGADDGLRRKYVAHITGRNVWEDSYKEGEVWSEELSMDDLPGANVFFFNSETDLKNYLDGIFDPVSRTTLEKSGDDGQYRLVWTSADDAGYDALPSDFMKGFKAGEFNIFHQEAHVEVRTNDARRKPVDID